MISLNNVSVQFSNNFILDNISLQINRRDRIGLVGKNGAGKTTLLRVLKGTQVVEGGQIAMDKNLSIGFLPQEILFEGHKSVFQETIQGFEKIMDLKHRIADCEKVLAKMNTYDPEHHASVIEQLNRATDQYNIMGGHNLEAETEKILLGLGFMSSQIHQSVSIFSGGWRMRIELAKILLQKPDLLLLDEPTNHLDIESIQWLENFLIKYPGAVIVVSHDRTFLDNVTNRTVEINYATLYDYNEHYSKYLIKREELIAKQISDYESQQKFIAQNEKFIERFRYKATKAKQVQSRVRMLDKLEKIEVDAIDSSSILFRFPPAPHSGKIVVEAEDLSKSFSDNLVLNKLDFLIDKGDKIAFVGKNGEGKTTLSRIIVGELNFEGHLKIGHNVSIGYYAQNETELLDPNKTVFETIDDIAVGDIRTKIRSILGAFLFSGETIEKKVSVLSGGEKSRLALVKLLLKPHNLLVLDEPTNHLDMRAKDILKNALVHFNGTLIIVSHDRHFLQGLTNKVFEFRNHQIKQYMGDVFDFLKSRNIETLKSLEAYKAPKDLNVAERSKIKSLNKERREQKKATEKEIRKLTRGIENYEKDISETESMIKEIETLMENPPEEQSPQDYDKLFKRYNELLKHNEGLLEQWTNAQSKLEQIKSTLDTD